MTPIYLSSTYEDLKDHRQAVFNALRRSGHQVIPREDYSVSHFAAEQFLGRQRQARPPRGAVNTSL
jgi:hypothetical protein